jgi:hypothetical protein
MSMMGAGGAGPNVAPHKPTLAWAVGIAVVAIIGYHFLMKKR